MSLQKLTRPSLPLVCKVANFSKVHILCSCPLLKRWSFPMTCLIFSLLDRPKSALQASARIQSASTSGVFTINKDNRTLIPLLERTHPHILVRMSSLLLNTARCLVWYLATAPLNCNNSTRTDLTWYERILRLLTPLSLKYWNLRMYPHKRPAINNWLEPAYSATCQKESTFFECRCI